MSVEALTTPAAFYPPFSSDEVPTKYGASFTALCQQGLYFLGVGEKLNRWLSKKDVVFAITHQYLLVTTHDEQLKRILVIKDLSRLLVLNGPTEIKAAFLMSPSSGDPGVVLSWKKATLSDPGHPLKVLVWIRKRLTSSPMEIRSMTNDQLSGLYQTTAFDKPADYMHGPWMRRRVVAAESPPSSPGGPLDLKRAPSLLMRPMLFELELPRHESNLGINFHAHNGVVQIESIEPGSPAARAGLAPGLVLSAIEDTEITSHADFKGALLDIKQRTPHPPIHFTISALPREAFPTSPIGPAPTVGSFIRKDNEWNLGPLMAPPPQASPSHSRGSEPFGQSTKSVEFTTLPPSRKSFREEELERKLTERDSASQADAAKLKAAEDRVALLERAAAEEEIFADNRRKEAEREKAQQDRLMQARAEAMRQAGVDPADAARAGIELRRNDSMGPRQHPRGPSSMDSLIDAHLVNQGPPTIIPLNDSVAFASNGDVVSFRPDDHGPGCISEYLNGTKVGRATGMFFDPETRILRDQNGAGGPVPQEDPLLLSRLAAFFAQHEVPVTIENPRSVTVPTPEGNTMQYTADMGRLQESYNNRPVGYTTKLTFNAQDGNLKNQDGDGVRLPSGVERFQILRDLALIGDECDVLHNIDVDAMEKLDEEKKVLEELRRKNGQLMRLREEQAELDRMQRDEEERDMLRRIELQKEEAEKARVLAEKDRELAALERDLAEREALVKTFANSAVSLYHKLRFAFEEDPADESSVMDTLQAVPSAVAWQDLCRFFEEDGDKLPTLLRSLTPHTARRAEALLKAKGIHLAPAGKARDSAPPKRRRAAAAAPSPSPAKRHPFSRSPTDPTDPAASDGGWSLGEDSLSETGEDPRAHCGFRRRGPAGFDPLPPVRGGFAGGSPHRQPPPQRASRKPSFRRRLTTPDVPAGPEQPRRRATFRNAPIVGAPVATPVFGSSPRPYSSPPLAVYPSPLSPRQTKDSASFRNPWADPALFDDEKSPLSSEWAETVIRRLEEAHTILTSLSPRPRIGNSKTDFVYLPVAPAPQSREQPRIMGHDTVGYYDSSEGEPDRRWKHAPGGAEWSIL